MLLSIPPPENPAQGGKQAHGRFKSRSVFFTFPSQHAPAQPFSIPPERSVRTLNLSPWVVSQGSVAQNKRCIVRDQRAMDLSIQIGEFPLTRTSAVTSAPSRLCSALV